jgi:hypothetical protein
MSATVRTAIGLIEDAQAHGIHVPNLEETLRVLKSLERGEPSRGERPALEILALEDVLERVDQAGPTLMADRELLAG